MANFFRSMISKLMGESSDVEPTLMNTPLHTPSVNPPNIPMVGMLLCPKHKPEVFYTVLDVETKPNDNEASLGQIKVRVQLFKIAENQKISSVWFQSCDQFWTYYDKCD